MNIDKNAHRRINRLAKISARLRSALGRGSIREQLRTAERYTFVEGRFLAGGYVSRYAND